MLDLYLPRIIAGLTGLVMEDGVLAQKKNKSTSYGVWLFIMAMTNAS